MPYILQEYDQALQTILDKGFLKKNRTGVNTLNIFGMQTRYKIDQCFPLLTGRKVWPKAIFAELIWFLSGSTNNKDLQKLGSNIWTPWTDSEFEKKNEFTEGALGPIYGFQLRHFGGYYGPGCDYNITYRGRTERVEYGCEGFDQLNYMIDELKNNPDSRRNLFSLWNPNDLNIQRLPCCHYSFQVYTEEDKISGMLTQRSADMPVGSPANIQFYSALLYMLGQLTGHKPYELVYSVGCAHIYVDQIEAVQEYLSREKPDSPQMELKQEKNIGDYKVDSFVIKEYKPLAPIKIPVQV